MHCNVVHQNQQSQQQQQAQKQPKKSVWIRAFNRNALEGLCVKDWLGDEMFDCYFTEINETTIKDNLSNVYMFKDGHVGVMD